MRRSYSACWRSAKLQFSAQASWSKQMTNVVKGRMFTCFPYFSTFSAASWKPRCSFLWSSSWKLEALLRGRGGRGDLEGADPGVGVTAPSLGRIMITAPRLSPGLSISGLFSTKQRSSVSYSLTDTRTCCSQLSRFWNGVEFRGF